MQKISQLAQVSNKAKIADDVEIGHYAIVEDGVQLDSGVKILPHAYICKGTSIGEQSIIHMGAVIGNVPQDLVFDTKRETGVKIGRKCVIREYATVHRSTREDLPTSVGDNSYLMVSSHLGHDCHVGSNVIIANCALLAGHVQVADGVFISGNVVIHQFCRIGTLAMIGGFTGINKDVPPYMIVRGPSVVRAINLIGLRRSKFPREIIEEIRAAFKLIYRSGLNTTQAIDEMKKLKPCREIDNIIEFISTSKRGICKAKHTDEDYFE